MEYLVYIIINLFLFWVFVAVGKSIEYHPKKKLGRLYTPVIVAYTLILGIKYNRGADYRHYQDVFNWNEGDSIDYFGRMIMPEEVANLALFLVSDIGNMIAGQMIYMSGGRCVYDIR